MITTATWVPRGFAAPFPTRYNFDEEEFERIAQLAKLQLDDAKEDLDEAQEQEQEQQEEGGMEVTETKPKKSKKKSSDAASEKQELVLAGRK